MIGDVHEALLCDLLVPNIDPEYIIEAVTLISDRVIREQILVGLSTFLALSLSNANKARFFQGPQVPLS